MKVFVFLFLLLNVAPALAQVGQEYGKAGFPRLITHLTKRSSELITARGHGIFQRVVCFNIRCRKEYARRKRISGISFEEFTKRIKRNARKGAYKTTPRDTTRKTLIPKEQIAKVTPEKKADVPQLKQDSVIILGGEVLFETDSYSLKDQHLPSLDSLIILLKSQPFLAIVSGHTDNTGKESYNHQLSAKRAEVVAKYLTDRGVPDENVSSEGFGSQRPIADNTSEIGRARNRRVEILIHRK
jgi:outer membrane protein OmpA-like peptidoglycan-associated protein